MDNIHFQTERTERRLERIVLIVLSLYTAASFATGLLSGWSIYIRELLFLPTVSGWFIYFREYWDHPRRANFISIACWTEFILYALFTDTFSAMLVTMAGVIVLLSIFNTQQILYPGLVVPFFLFFYHGFVARTIAITGPRSALRLGVQFLSLYTVSAVIWIIQKNRREASELLIEKIRELEIAERSKDDFLVNVSHEIRTPINAVCGMSEAVLQEDLPACVRRDVLDIQTAGRNLLSTVSNILDFSELASGKLTLAEESYNITSTITDIINMTLTMDHIRHLELIVDCEACLPCNLLGDEQKFRRVVMNLLGNAVKFTKEGGVILRITGRKEEYGINLQVSVRDSGIGIERTDMEKIFTSFSQVNTKRNREAGGVGLGLAISQALVRSMGGFMTVESTPGTGSEFQFTIPQKVLDETPIVSVRDKTSLFAACYINLDKYDYTVVREGYENCMQHIVSQFDFPFRICRNLPELKRRIDREAYTHIFIGWEEYNEDRLFFDRLCTERTVVLLLDYDQEQPLPGNMLRIYKPFTVLSIAAVFNGQKALYGEDQYLGLHNGFIAPQAHVLIVDDNAMNLKVMSRLLLPYQLNVTLAGSGQEALEKLNAASFDCVFLDHMMPEMDGVETLHKIRQKPGLYYQSLPVIAFTANAIGGAREMFISEGFSDFIAKPIELSVLERILRRYLPSQMQIPVEDVTIPTAPAEKAADEAASAVQKDTKTDEKGTLPQAEVPAAADGSDPIQERDDVSKGRLHLARAGVDVEQALAYCGDEAGFREIIAMFHAEGEKRQNNLTRCFGEQDWKNYVICVHALKGNAKGIGAGELSRMAEELEMAGKENRIAYILEHHEAMMADHNRLLDALDGNAFVYPDMEMPEAPAFPPAKDGLKPQLSASAKGTTENMPAEEDADALYALLSQIEEKLSAFENEDLPALLDRLSLFAHEGKSLTGLADSLRELTQDFDFLGALEILERMDK